MKAIRISAGKPELIDTAKPAGNDVLVRVASSSICGSDLHLINLGWVEGRIMGHEFAGYAPDGKAVAVEPVVGCNHCDYA
jgi:threonine dehydrogenase-like Zn-dependent dehydrogenase